MSEAAPQDVRAPIARPIAGPSPDGATRQLGIGALPHAVLKYLFTKKDLGVHSELISDGVIDLVEAGVLTGARKSLHPGKIICGFLLGTRRLYDWVDNNPLVELHRTEYVNDPFVVAQNDRMVAINSAIEVDLTGQVCADSIGPKMHSAVGGQLDFIYGASRAKGGVPIIALPSTSQLRDGTVVSKIVPMLKLGAGVVTSRNHVRFVVTEYGVADLYGKSVRQRTQALNDARSSVLTLTGAGGRMLEAAQGSVGDELATRLGAAVSPRRLGSFASTVRDLRHHIATQRRSAR
jgi:acetyl-CoA hydrolase